MNLARPWPVALAKWWAWPAPSVLAISSDTGIGKSGLGPFEDSLGVGRRRHLIILDTVVKDRWNGQSPTKLQTAVKQLYSKRNSQANVLWVMKCLNEWLALALKAKEGRKGIDNKVMRGDNKGLGKSISSPLAFGHRKYYLHLSGNNKKWEKCNKIKHQILLKIDLVHSLQKT